MVDSFMSSETGVEPISVLNIEAEKTEPATCQLNRKDLFSIFSVALILFSLNYLWYYYDHHIPMMDEAGHILRSIAYSELFLHFRPFSFDWWQEFLKVSQFYPPALYIVAGFFKAIFGVARLVDIAVHCFCASVLGVSVYLSVRLLGFGGLAACTAAFLADFYPEVAFLNHMIMLDFPTLSASALGVTSLIFWWRYPTIGAAILAGAVIGFCCLTKQTVTAFIVGTGVYYTVLAFLGQRTISRKNLFLQLATIVVVTVAIGTPWILTNFSEMNSINSYMNADLVERGEKMSHLECFLYYLKSYWFNLGPLLCSLFIVSTVCTRISDHRKLLPLWSGALVGFAMMCLYIYPLDRYIVSTFVLTAAISGVFLERLWNSGRALPRVLVSVLLVLSSLQYVSFNFSPYPLSSPFLTGVSQWMAVDIPVDFFGKDGHKDNPIPYRNWGYDWALQTIERYEHGMPVYLNVLMNEPNLNAQTFDLETKERKLPVTATTSLIWTVVGDQLEFSQESALYYHWYLVKDRMKRKFKDAKSEESYKSLLDFLKNSGRFEWINSMKTPEGDSISLYRQKRQ